MDKQQDEQDAADFDDSDFAWGREAIGRAIGRTPNQVTWLVGQGLLAGAVKRVGHRTLVGSKKKLRALAARLIDQSP